MESIARRWREIKWKIKRLMRHPAASDVVLVLVITLVGFGAFGLGRLSVEEDHSVTLCELPAAVTEAAGEVKSATTEVVGGEPAGEFVGSVNSDVYHAPWCPGADRISEENKIYFTSTEEAEAAGYRPAKNCPELTD